VARLRRLSTVARLRLALAALLLLAPLHPAAADDPAAGAGGARAQASGEGPASAPEEPENPAACAEEMARRVQSHYEAVRDLSAEFVQTSSLASLGPAPEQGSDETRGEVVFAKPGRMRWHYLEPAESLVVSDGEDLWTYDPELGEAQHMPVGRGYLSGAAIQFLMGEGEILETFRVEARGCGGPRVALELVPREPASYERLALEVDRESGQVVSTEVVDLFGNVTRVSFSDIRTNTNAPQELFRFEPPEGTEVIEVAPARSPDRPDR